MHVEGDFWAHGAACVRGAFTPEQITLAEAAIDANLASLSGNARRASPGDDMVHAPRRWVTSPSFPGLVDELPDGAPLEHPLFPVLWNA